jgi:DNA-binding CsgD family transcriptional regulator
MPKSEFRKTAMFNEWYLPQGDHSSIVCKVPVAASLGVLAVQRGGSQPDFDVRDISLFRALAPIVARAAEFHVRFGHVEIGSDNPGSATVGQMVVDGLGEVLIMNANAETFLTQSANDLTLRHGRLSAGEPVSRRALRRAVAAVCGSQHPDQRTGGDVLIRCPVTGSPRLALTVVPFMSEMSLDLPVARAALIVVQDLLPRDAPWFSQALRGLFDLTQKEAELGAVLVSGRSLQSYASEHQVSYETARTHLRNIFQKTATARQGELVALLNRVMRMSDHIH